MQQIIVCGTLGDMKTRHKPNPPTAYQLWLKFFAIRKYMFIAQVAYSTTIIQRVMPSEAAHEELELWMDTAEEEQP